MRNVLVACLVLAGCATVPERGTAQFENWCVAQAAGGWQAPWDSRHPVTLQDLANNAPPECKDYFAERIRMESLERQADERRRALVAAERERIATEERERRHLERMEEAKAIASLKREDPYGACVYLAKRTYKECAAKPEKCRNDFDVEMAQCNTIRRW